MDGWKEPGRLRMGMELPGPEGDLAQPLRTAVNNPPLPGPAAERGHGARALAVLQVPGCSFLAWWQQVAPGRCGMPVGREVRRPAKGTRVTGDERGKGREEDSPPRALTAARSRPHHPHQSGESALAVCIDAPHIARAHLSWLLALAVAFPFWAWADGRQTGQLSGSHKLSPEWPAWAFQQHTSTHIAHTGAWKVELQAHCTHCLLWEILKSLSHLGAFSVRHQPILHRRISDSPGIAPIGVFPSPQALKAPQGSSRLLRAE